MIQKYDVVIDSFGNVDLVPNPKGFFYKAEDIDAIMEEFELEFIVDREEEINPCNP